LLLTFAARCAAGALLFAKIVFMETLLAGHDPNGWMLLFPLGLFIYYGVLWIAVGQDPKPGTILPQYGPPEAMSPGAVRYLVTTGSDGRSFAAVLVQLAHRGFVCVEPRPPKYLVRREPNPPANPSSLAPEEAQVLRILFSDGPEVLLDPTQGPLLSVYVAAIQKALVARMEGKYFTRNAGWIILAILATILFFFVIAFAARGKDTSGLLFLSWWFLFVTMTVGFIARVSLFAAWRGASRAHTGYGMALLGTLALAVFMSVCVWIAYHITTKVSPAYAFTLVGMVAAHLIFAPALRRITPECRKALDHIEGFRSFLNKVEQDRLNRLRLPDDELRAADGFLPYAIALEIKEAWGDHLAQAFLATTVMR
jgi:hypothetical protein